MPLFSPLKQAHRSIRRRPVLSVLLSIVFAVLCAQPASAEVPEALVAELQGTVDAALTQEAPEARAWALRALALKGGREARQTLLDYAENTDLIVRLFSGLGLLEMGRREAYDILTSELVSAGRASRQRILDRYVRHLDADAQRRLLEETLEQVSDADETRDIVTFIAEYGNGEVFELLERAADVGPELRAVYMEALADSGRPEAMGVVEELAGSRDAAVRLEAAEVAHAIGGDEGRRLLEALLSDESAEVADAAAFALAPMGVAAAYDRLDQIAQSGDDAARALALEAIRDGQPQLLGFDSLVAMLETTEDPDLVRRIYEAIGATGRDEAVAMLGGLLQGDVFEARLYAIAGLGYSGREEAVPLLADVLLGGGGPELRRPAAEALGHLGLASAAEPLLAALERERGGEVEVAVVEALGHAQSEDALWPVAFLLSDEEDAIVLAALKTLGAMGSREVAAQVERTAVSHRDPQVRWQATLVLFSLDPEVGEIRLLQALERPPDGFMADIDSLPESLRVEAYTRLLDHSNPDIRAVAAGRVRRLADGGLDVFREVVGSTLHGDVRELAVSVLTANRDPADLARFEEWAESTNRTIRTQALEAVVELARPESEELLRQLLVASDPVRPAMAVYGLWRMASTDAP